MMGFDERKANITPIENISYRTFILENQTLYFLNPDTHNWKTLQQRRSLRRGAISELDILVISFSSENSTYKLRAWKENNNTDNHQGKTWGWGGRGPMKRRKIDECRGRRNLWGCAKQSTIKLGQTQLYRRRKKRKQQTILSPESIFSD